MSTQGYKIATTRFVQARLRLGLTQAELAARAGINKSYWNGAEHGRRILRPATAEAVASALGITLDEALNTGLMRIAA